MNQHLNSKIFERYLLKNTYTIFGIFFVLVFPVRNSI